MRLERLEVAGFGPLRHRRFEFGERLTVVLGPNESGKSTVHRAIRAALYGVDAGGPGRPRDRSDRARWLPWASERYGLTLVYRLDSGRRFRVAQSFEHDRSEAQVQELGGGDVTQHFRVGRAVCPGRFHLGIDEAVFCAAAWLGEEGLQLAAADAAPQQAGRLREALERLIDSGAEGVTAAAALERLRDALQRVGSERRSTSPLGVATARARRLEADIDAAQRRLGAFAADQDRLHELEAGAMLAGQDAATAQRSWMLGRLGQLYEREQELVAAAAEVMELTAVLEGKSEHAAFPLEDEALVIGLGGELHQAERTAAELEGRWATAQDSLKALLRRRGEIVAGLRAMPVTAPGAEAAVTRADRLRRRIEVSAAVAGSDAGLAVVARDEALRREIAVTGLGGIAAAELDGVAEVIGILRSARRRRRLGLVLLMVVGICGTAAAAWLAAAGRGAPAAMVAVISAAALAGLATTTLAGSRAMARARSRLATRLPGSDLTGDGLERLAASLPVARRLHAERQQQAVMAGARGAELARARAELEALAEECLCLARDAGCEPPAMPPPGSRTETLLATAATALDAVDEVGRRAARRHQLDAEDAALAAREEQLAEVGQEAERSASAAAALSERIRRATAAAGIDPALPPLAAVAAFREACDHRREHDRLAAALAEARRRQRLGGEDVQTISRQRAALLTELRRRGAAIDGVDAGGSVDSSTLTELERAATTAQERSAAASAAAAALRARLEGLTDSLPSLADLEDDRLAVTAARDRALHQQEAIQRAIAMIEAAGRDVHSQLAPRLAASLSRRLAHLTGDRYSEANVDMDRFAITLAPPDRERMVPLDLLSHGTRDQVCLLLRLALCEVLGDGGESMPLLLDEPLVSADRGRRRRLLEFLTELSSSNQVVITTSDPEVAAALVSGGEPASAVLIELDGVPVSLVPGSLEA